MFHWHLVLRQSLLVVLDQLLSPPLATEVFKMTVRNGQKSLIPKESFVSRRSKIDFREQLHEKSQSFLPYDMRLFNCFC